MNTKIVTTFLFAALALAQAQTSPQGKISPPQGKPQRPTGMVAVTVNPKGSTPFTIQDVAEYFKVNNLPKNRTTNTQFQVTSLVFITNAEAVKRLSGVYTGLGDSELVGFATLSGSFQFGGPSGSVAGFEQRAYALFDGASGNLLMVGSL